MLHVACVWLDIYVCTRLCMYACAQVCMCVHACVWACVCMCVCLHLRGLACAHMYLLLCACLCVDVPHKTTHGVAHCNVFLVSLVIYHMVTKTFFTLYCSVPAWNYAFGNGHVTYCFPLLGFGFFCGLSPNNQMHSGSGDRPCRWWKRIFCMTHLNM